MTDWAPRLGSRADRRLRRVAWQRRWWAPIFSVLAFGLGLGALLDALYSLSALLLLRFSVTEEFRHRLLLRRALALIKAQRSEPPSKLVTSSTRLVRGPNLAGRLHQSACGAAVV